MDKSEEKTPVDVATDIDVVESQSQSFSRRTSWLTKVAAWGVEVRGITPISLEERTDPRFINVFFVWFTMSTNLLPYVASEQASFQDID